MDRAKFGQLKAARLRARKRQNDRRIPSRTIVSKICRGENHSRRVRNLQHKPEVGPGKAQRSALGARGALGAGGERRAMRVRFAGISRKAESRGFFDLRLK